MLIAVLVVTAYPFFYVLFMSVMPYENYVKSSIHALPSGFTATYFQQILQDTRLTGAYEVSILKTAAGTLLSVIVTVMGGYALSRTQLKYGRFLTVLFLIPLFTNSGLIPAYLNFQSLGLLNTFWVLILPGVAAPFNLFIARTFFSDFPQELIEAATIDGASQFGIFWRVVWPTSTPIIATLAMLYGVAHWNEYFWPSILVQSNLQPASVLLQNIVANRSVLQGLGLGIQMAPQSFIAAVAALLIIPVLVAYPFVQRYVVTGILLGSVKG
ncbi:MAG TPA: carbohydrate ABC transporter permease [Aggregatilineaceae bacterium]|nr:carbohydrate ABC transporter permease [Aggregatilineaceae bacterium]